MIVLGQALALTGLIFGRGEVLALDELFDAGIFLTFVGVLLIFIRVRQSKEKTMTRHSSSSRVQRADSIELIIPDP